MCDSMMRVSDCGAVVTGGVSTTRLTEKPPAAERARRAGTAGDADRIARGFSEEVARFVARLDIAVGERVLDVACGTGNVALAVARYGAAVTGFDIVSSVPVTARRLAAEEGLSIRFDEGDPARLPYEDGAFDTVVTMFGAMFAAEPARVASELLRVTRPGGRIAMANWVPDGFIGRMFRVQADNMPSGGASPLLWGDPEVVRTRLAPGARHLTTARRSLVLRCPRAPAGEAEPFRASYGPTGRVFPAIGPDSRAQLGARLTALWSKVGEAERGFTCVPAEYLEVVARRAAA